MGYFTGETLLVILPTEEKRLSYSRFFSGRCDEDKQKIYAHDVVYSSTLKTSGIVLFRPEKGAFIFCVQRGKLQYRIAF